MKDHVKEFTLEKSENLKNMSNDPKVAEMASAFQAATEPYKWQYQFTWLGRPIIQFPTDMLAVQEAIYSIQPDLIIETGIAHGGNVVYLASLLELMEICKPSTKFKREVVAIDIEIRAHNRKALDEHPLRNRIVLLEGASTVPKIVSKVYEIAARHKNVMVLLDSSHTHEHVYGELNAYSPLISVGSYIIVQDTGIEFSNTNYDDRPWGKGNNPYTALKQFLSENDNFEIDKHYENKALITSTNAGWLKRIW